MVGEATRSPLGDLVLPEALRARLVGVVAWARTHPPRDVLVIVSGPEGSGRDAIGDALVAELGTGGLVVDGERLGALDLRDLVREARWHDAAIVVRRPSIPALIAEAAAALPVPLVVVADEPSARALATDSGRATALVEVPAMDAHRRAALWTRALRGKPGADELDPAALAVRFRAGPTRIASAVAQVLATEGAVSERALRIACRTSTIGGLAQRLECSFEPDDLVVPATTRAELDLARLWATHGPTVFRQGAVGGRLALGGGPVVMFTGPPGTGKTMAAQVLAGLLGRDLLRVDLSRVVDNHLGETEKHLDRAFADAERDGAILFFDEADALFGKRTDVKDAHDRYANVETGYLLQRLERTPGICPTVFEMHHARRLSTAGARSSTATRRAPSRPASRRRSTRPFSSRARGAGEQVASGGAILATRA